MSLGFEDFNFYGGLEFGTFQSIHCKPHSKWNTSQINGDPLAEQRSRKKGVGRGL
jgi:hypothetical protein